MHDEVNQLCESESHSVMSDSFAIPWTVAHQAPCPWNYPGKNTGVKKKKRILEWVAIPLSREFSQPRDRSQVSSIADRFFTVGATGKSIISK